MSCFTPGFRRIIWIVLLEFINCQKNVFTSKFRFANGAIGRFSRKLELSPLEKLALEDDIGREWLEYGAARMSTPSARKYAQIKTLYLTYQKWPSFGKFDYYGCYCFPEGNNLALGRGDPVDAVDSACKRWLMCYQCAELDVNLADQKGDYCNARTAPYEFVADVDPTTQLPKISCHMNGGHDTCNRAICECDAEFVKNLAKHQEKFDITKHQIWSNFDSSECTASNLPNKPKVDREPEGLENTDSSNVRVKPVLRTAAQESLALQLENSNKSQGGKEDRGIIDSCCVKEYPKFNLFRSTSQHCCKSQMENSIASVFHAGIDKRGNSFMCCRDGHVVKSDSDCVAGTHTEF